MAERCNVLPRAGGVLDQDPLELAKLQIAMNVIDEKREQDRKQQEAR